MRKVAWTLCLVIGCGGRDKKADQLLIQGEVADYLAAAEKVDATKTHASGDYLMACRERDGHLRNLSEISYVIGRKDPVLAEIRSVRSLAQEERDAVQQKVNHLQVVGRGHSPEEKEWLTNGAPQEIRKIEFRLSALDELESKVK